jgi:hypothetical protein
MVETKKNLSKITFNKDFVAKRVKKAGYPLQLLGTIGTMRHKYMVKKPRKDQGLPINLLNSINNVSLEHKKSKQQIDKDYYQKNKEHKKQQRRERYAQQKEQMELSTKQQLGKYYGAEAFKILMSFKKYTELSKEKQQL